MPKEHWQGKGERERERGRGSTNLSGSKVTSLEGQLGTPMSCHLALLHSVTVQVPYLEGSPLFRSVVN